MNWKGKLLLANPTMADPNFSRTAVLLVAHETEEGALGIVLNRPLASGAGPDLGRWKHLAAEPNVIFEGGPVSPESIIALGTSAVGLSDPSPESIQFDSYQRRPLAMANPVIEEFVREGQQRSIAISDTLWIVDLSKETEMAQVVRLRLFGGYAGWAPLQLEDEVNAKAWLLVDAFEADVFCPVAHQLWERALKRQGGEIALLANYPTDPTMN